ncbi:MAG: hypothetical protein RLY64_95 [Bacteroidota bacterium]
MTEMKVFSPCKITIMKTDFNLTIPNLKVSDSRKEILQPLVQYLQGKVDRNETIRLNFICTHNSRRSHLAQIWAQAMAHQIGIRNFFSYSGGTESTAVFPVVLEVLEKQGFQIQALSHSENPVYSIKYASNEMPLICFSKEYHHPFNPKGEFAAVLTCDSADEGCPLVLGADARFPIKYQDPKIFDGTDLQKRKYTERSLEIASEMYWIFNSIKFQ